MRRVVITGMGAISPLGNDCASTWRGIEENRCELDQLRILIVQILKPN